jgi:spore germination protein KC
MKKCRIIFLAILLPIPLLAGCWNQEELTNLAIVMAMGIDKADDNQGYTITLEIVNPGNAAPMAMGGGQGAPVAVYKNTGRTVFEAGRRASKEISRLIYYAHTSALVISEQVAKEGIFDILDVLDRDPVFRTTTQVFIARNTTAESVVSTLTILDKMPVNKIVKSLNATEKMLGENTKTTIDGLIENIVSNGKEPFVSGVVLPGPDKMGKKLSNIAADKPDVIIKTDGMAMFKGGKLVGWVDGKKSRGVVWVLNKVKGTDLLIDWQGKKDSLGIIIRRSDVKVNPNMKNGKPVINIAINTEGDVQEVNTAVDISNPAIIKKIEEKAGEEIKKEVSESIKTVQHKKSDVVGFGEKFHKAYPKRWKKLEGNWGERFATLEVSVKVDAYIRRHGIRNKPFWSDLKD